MSEKTTGSKKYEEARDSLPPDLVPVFDDLVEQYKFFAMKHHSHPFVSYVVLADLILTGWRPTATEIKEQRR
jgi:hypothetical protein